MGAALPASDGSTGAASPIDLAAIAVPQGAPPERSTKRRRRKLTPHSALYAISEAELAERLAERRRSRLAPRRDRGQSTTHHRLCLALEPGQWVTTGFLAEATGKPLSRVTALVLKLSRFPYLLLERAPIAEVFPGAAESPYRVPSPLTLGGCTLRTPAKWVYRLTPAGEDLRWEGRAFMRQELLA